MKNNCNGFFGLGWIEPKQYLQTVLPRYGDIVSFDDEPTKQYHIFLEYQTFTKLYSKLYLDKSIIMVSSNPYYLSMTNCIPIDYTKSYEYKSPIKIYQVNMDIEIYKKSAIKSLVEVNSTSDFMSAYINLISYIPENNRKSLKSIIASCLFGSSSIEEAKIKLNKILGTSIVEDRFMYQFEKDLPLYKKAVLTNDFKNIDSYVITFFRSNL